MPVLFSTARPWSRSAGKSSKRSWKWPAGRRPKAKSMAVGRKNFHRGRLDPQCKKDSNYAMFNKQFANCANGCGIDCPETAGRLENCTRSHVELAFPELRCSANLRQVDRSHGGLMVFRNTSAVRGRLTAICVLACATTVAMISARPFAGGWNDGSRL